MKFYKTKIGFVLLLFILIPFLAYPFLNKSLIVNTFEWMSASGQVFDKVIWVRETGKKILERIEKFNDVIHELKVTLKPNRSAMMRKPTYSTDNLGPDVFQNLKNFSGVRIIALSWSNQSTGTWSSLDDTANILIQKYHRSTMDACFCEAMMKGGSNEFRYEVFYNQTVNCVLPERLVYSGITTKTLHHTLFARPGEKTLRSEYWSPPLSLTYIIVFDNAVVSGIGNVFTSDIRFIIHACAVGENFPDNWAKLPYFDHVFVISQYWGTGHFHRSIEVIPRLAPFLDFLRNNPDVYILCPNAGDGVMQKTFEVLGLEHQRMISGWVRGGHVYMPKPSFCGMASVLEIQLLASEFRKYMNRNFGMFVEERNHLVYIKRSSRTFANETEIVKALQSICTRFNLTLDIFTDRPLPTFEVTMRLFSAARIVVAPHGAGLSNVIYSRPDTLVVEGLYETWYANLCYKRLAYVLGLQYYGALSNGGNRGVINIKPDHLTKILSHYLSKRIA